MSGSWPPPAAEAAARHRAAMSAIVLGPSPLARQLSKSVAGRSVRDRVLARDGDRCRCCGVPVSGLGGNGDRRSTARGTYARSGAVGSTLDVDHVFVVCAGCRARIGDGPIAFTFPTLMPPPPASRGAT